MTGSRLTTIASTPGPWIKQVVPCVANGPTAEQANLPNRTCPAGTIFIYKLKTYSNEIEITTKFLPLFMEHMRWPRGSVPRSGSGTASGGRAHPQSPGLPVDTEVACRIPRNRIEGLKREQCSQQLLGRARATTHPAKPSQRISNDDPHSAFLDIASDKRDIFHGDRLSYLIVRRRAPGGIASTKSTMPCARPGPPVTRSRALLVNSSRVRPSEVVRPKFNSHDPKSGLDMNQEVGTSKLRCGTMNRRRLHALRMLVYGVALGVVLTNLVFWFGG